MMGDQAGPKRAGKAKKTMKWKPRDHDHANSKEGVCQGRSVDCRLVTHKGMDSKAKPRSDLPRGPENLPFFVYFGLEVREQIILLRVIDGSCDETQRSSDVGNGGAG
jgi:hypothetical protein